jgi:hypothetical protein
MRSKPFLSLARESLFHPLAAGADLLDRLLHRTGRAADLFRFIADFVTLPTRHAGAILLTAACGLLLAFANLASLVLAFNAERVPVFRRLTAAARFGLSASGISPTTVTEKQRGSRYDRSISRKKLVANIPRGRS